VDRVETGSPLRSRLGKFPQRQGVLPFKKRWLAKKDAGRADRRKAPGHQKLVGPRGGEKIKDHRTKIVLKKGADPRIFKTSGGGGGRGGGGGGGGKKSRGSDTPLARYAAVKKSERKGRKISQTHHLRGEKRPPSKKRNRRPLAGKKYEGHTKTKGVSVPEVEKKKSQSGKTSTPGPTGEGAEPVPGNGFFFGSWGCNRAPVSKKWESGGKNPNPAR